MSLYELEVTSIKGETFPLERYRGRVLLIVNVASKCGFTGQYKGLEELYRDYEAKGLTVLGFPCNQFLSQEPGTEEEIAAFCSLNYDVTFPLFSKINVNGADTHPLYTFLKARAPGLLGSKKIKWNFTKFLVDRSGERVERYAPSKSPGELAARIETLLSEPAPV